MAFAKKAAFEHFRQTAIRDLKPTTPKVLEEMRKQLIETLEATGDIVVQKARRTEHADALLELVCSWTAIDTSHPAIQATLLEAWPGRDLGKTEEVHWVESRDEAVLLQSVSRVDGKTYASVKVLVLV